jgi:pyruvate/oxaloacetate carboxyltransferase
MPVALKTRLIWGGDLDIFRVFWKWNGTRNIGMCLSDVKRKMWHVSKSLS